MTDRDEISIKDLGARGDGIGTDGHGESHFVKSALPGERWRPDGNDGFKLIAPIEQRVTPVCGHFGTCGGCVAQHMREDLYASWKLGIVQKEFERRGIDPGHLEIADVPMRSRRRCVLSAVRDGDEVRLGFHVARSHDIVDLAECPVLVPGIVGSFRLLRSIADVLLGSSGTLRFTVLACEHGLDIDVGGQYVPLGEDRRRKLVEVVQAQGVARLTADGDVIAQFAAPSLRVGGFSVPVPSGAFVQAVGAAEEAMAADVAAAAADAKYVADLFCGIGTFALTLARTARVLAIDSDRPAVAALDAARKTAQGLKPIDARRRDLIREPLSRKELEGFGCVVFDPPRAGAEAQAWAVSKSKVPVVVAVSCNPATLARDSRLLLDGGYQLQRLRVIDQFRYSAQIECVAVFRRDDRRRGRARTMPARS
ncbi:MAG: class I SAM-dependent RNA methyltransferase [Hyphomicrobiaceae bacterium]